VFELPTPIFRSPLFRCSDWFNASNPICVDGLTIERDYLNSYRAPAVAAIEEVRKALPGAYVRDPFPVLCPDTTCRMVRDGKPLHLDGDRLSAYGNRVLLPNFTATMEGLRRNPR
jgi:hypothetical protein